MDEAKAKNALLDTADWKLLDRGNGIPQQTNGFDCVVFIIMCAVTIANDLPISIETYCQKDMAENLIKIASAILKGRLK